MTTSRKSPAKPRGRPPGKDIKPKVLTDEGDEVGFDLGVVYGGVSASWLAHVFGMDRNTVKKKLSSGGCEVVGMYKGSPQYKLKDAAAYLVEPKVDIHAYMKSMRYNDLPPMLQAAYWDGMRKRQQYMKEAQDLWHTDQVLDVLGELAGILKSSIMLFPDNVDGLSPKQEATLQREVDNLLNSIHSILVTAPQSGHTLSSADAPGFIPDATLIESDDEEPLV